ncbi:hypothetical protein NDU88_008938 [Pleurodeles waltl]|uniref:Reverse transcriptase domain-containing protein n=1 Tax=Pleurodeles waltl TaxID=8319 RepID=A0AAV7RYC7_PLEWA|nr:hypothetical protein NDU88_008938 [Pleurodeles waltl]
MRDPSCDETTAGVLAVDIEKAFDSLEWCFLYVVLSKMGLGKDYIVWLGLLYTAIMARVCPGWTISDSYAVKRGTRQGCPLLFAIAMEPLAVMARGETGVQGYEQAGGRGIT